MRSWLNGYGASSNDNFFATAFTPAEQVSILTTTVDNPKEAGTPGGNTTYDKIFLLKYADVVNPSYGFSASNSWMSPETTRQAKATDYAKAHGAFLFRDTGYSYTGCALWWLRGPYDRGVTTISRAAVVHYDGSASAEGFYNGAALDGHHYQDRNVAVRPAIKLDLASLAFTATAPGIYAARPATEESPTTRHPGDDRRHTAMLASASAFAPGSSPNVIIAKDSDFPDALSASYLAGALDCPVLLSETGRADGRVMAEMARLGVQKVYILGDEESITAEAMGIYGALAANGATRVSGGSRYSTATAVAREVARATGTAPAEAFLTRGDNFPDALAASPLAASQGVPVLLTVKDSATLAPETQGYLDATPSIKAIHILGDGNSVDYAIDGLLRSRGIAVDRWSGSGEPGTGRYETAADIVDKAVARYGLAPRALGLATGAKPYDALAGGAAMAHKGGVLLLTPLEGLHPATAGLISRHGAGITAFEIYGDHNSVSTDIQDEVDALLK
jgi:putative cell wall-binding protein